MDRRQFVALTATALPAIRTLAQTLKPAAATLKLLTGQPGPRVPANFIGLSYETQQLSDPTFFSAANTGLIAQFRALAPHGVLRLGGNTSDIGWWKPTPEATAPTIHVRDTGPGEPTSALAYAIEPQGVRNLRGFLDATGWTCIYGINLGTNTPDRAAEQAAFVAPTLGDKLEYFQLGNEPDLFSTHLRDKATWNPDAYMDEWLAEANAIRVRVPSARFGLPDIAWTPAWHAQIVARLVHTPNPPTIVSLSHHCYVGGPPSNPAMTVEKILSPNPDVPLLGGIMHTESARLAAATHSPVAYRMTEGNTCYRGGKPGVSDVFAAALWSADYLLQLASLGYAGVNLHGGDGQMVANSLGGKLPGDEIVLAQHGNPAEHPHPYYTPIAHIGPQYLLEPVAYGMKFAGLFAGATIVPVEFDPGPVNATAYAATLPNGATVLAIVNKDATQDLHLDRIELPPPSKPDGSDTANPMQLSVDPERNASSTVVGPDGPGFTPNALATFRAEYVLSAPSLTSTEALLAPPKGRFGFTVPHATAVLFHRAAR
jgi:hypothetical protein